MSQDDLSHARAYAARILVTATAIALLGPFVFSTTLPDPYVNTLVTLTLVFFGVDITHDRWATIAAVARGALDGYFGASGGSDERD